MPYFRIFAAGTVDFHTSHTGMDIGDIFALQEALNNLVSGPRQLHEVPGFLRGQAVTRGTSFASQQVLGGDFTTPASQQALTAMGSLQIYHVLRDAIEMTVASASPLQIALYARGVAGLILDGTSAYKDFVLRAENRPVDEFGRKALPALERAGMNCLGVLAAIAGVFARYSSHLSRRPRDGLCRLNIQIFGL
jgi:hypothetical protein